VSPIFWGGVGQASGHQAGTNKHRGQVRRGKRSVTKPVKTQAVRHGALLLLEATPANRGLCLTRLTAIAFGLATSGFLQAQSDKASKRSVILIGHVLLTMLLLHSACLPPRMYNSAVGVLSLSGRLLVSQTRTPPL